MMNAQTIRKLEVIKAREFNFDDVNKTELLEAMLDNIGHKDSTIRDDLIYPVLGHLLHDGHFNEDVLTDIVYRLLDADHLMHDLDNTNRYSVLTRSFSALQIVVLLNVHRQQNVIERVHIEKAFEAFLEYFEKENVFDGFNKEVGWMHAVAHSADVFDEFMQITWFEEAKLQTMFEAIERKMKQSRHVFIFNEDERMAVALKNGIERNILSNKYLKKWVDKVATYDKPSSLPESIYLENNVKNFLRALYFKMIDHEDHKTLTAHIRYYLMREVS